MTNLDIIKQLNQLNLQINNLISLLSEQTVINSNQITEDNINEAVTVIPELFLGSEFQEEVNLFDEAVVEISEGEAFSEPVVVAQEMIVDDGEELI